MRSAGSLLLNTSHVEIWPGGLLRARSNQDARLLARARHVLRRKRDGRYLAIDLPEGVHALVPSLHTQPGIAEALGALETLRNPRHLPRTAQLPLHRLRERLDALGLDDDYGERTGLPLVAEPAWLAFAGFDRYRRPLWLHADAAHAWTRMRAAALHDGVAMDAVSGYRSHDYQLGIFERKLARGLVLEDILGVNAAPGYSEHHSGRALDIGAPGEPAAEASFEHTPAFAWLRDHGADHGFTMSYPPGNPHGIVYEPWHWCWQSPHEPAATA
ncbi:MAG: dacA [Xanthomonadaceae bacterium]|nr:dacA [Xanthomonadaceae bacterium]